MLSVLAWYVAKNTHMMSGLIYMHVVSEAPRVVFKKNRKYFKKFTGMEGIDNRLIVSHSKIHKIPENILYFKAHVNTVNTCTPQISPTDCKLCK